MKLFDVFSRRAEEESKEHPKPEPEAPAPAPEPKKSNWIKDLTGKDIHYLRAVSNGHRTHNVDFTLVINEDIVHLIWKTEAIKHDFFFYYTSKTIFVNGELRGRYELDQLYAHLKFILEEVDAHRAVVEMH